MATDPRGGEHAGMKDPDAVQGLRPFVAFWSLGLLFSLILTLPFLVLVLYLYFSLLPVDARLAATVSLASLLAYLALALRHFALMRIRVGDAGMSVTSRFLRGEDRTPWEYVKFRHLAGPLFTLGDPPTRWLSLATSLWVFRYRKFLVELRKRGVLSPEKGSPN